MGNVNIHGAARRLIASFVSTLGVGSTWTSSVADVSMFKSFTGIFNASSSNVTMAFDQSGTNSPWDVSSTVALLPGASVLSWTGVGQFGRARISAVNSSAGEVMRLHVFGVPI